MSTTAAQLAAEIVVEGDDEAKTKLDQFGRKVDETARKQESSQRSSAAQAEGMRTVAQGATVAGVALSAGFFLAERATIGFDKAMSGVGAVANATEDDLDRLRQAAIQAGQDTAFSASEAADAEAELARNGLSVADVLGGALTGSLALAAAGQVAVADSATITSGALKQFNLEGSEAMHVADLLAASASNTASDVLGMGDSLAQSGLVAKQTGLTLEETIGTLSLFADKMLKGSDAGTSLKTMLQRLTPQSDEARQTMDALGISAYDAQGRFVGMERFADSLRAGLSDLTDEQRNAALATIFGSDAVRAAAIIYDAGGKGIASYTALVNDQGAAQRMAGEQLDNLAGDLEQFRGSVETALIEGGSKATGALRGLTQAATGMVNAFSDAPGWLQTTTLGLAGVGGAALTMLGTVGMIAPKIREGIASIRAMTLSSQLALGGLAAGLTVGALLVAHYAQKKAEATARTKEFTDALRAENGALGDGVEAVIKKQIADRGLGDDLDALNGHITGNASAYDLVRDSIDGNEAALQRLRAAMLASGEVQLRNLNDGLITTKDVLDAAKKSWIETGTVANDAGESFGYADDAGTGLVAMVDELAGATRKTRDDLKSTESATLSYADAQREQAAAERELQDLVVQGYEGGEKYAAAQERLADANAKVQAAQDAVNEVTDRASTSLDDVALSAEDAQKALDAYKGTLDSIIGTAVGVEQANLGYLEDLQAITDAVKENGTSLDQNTEQGRANRQEIAGTVGDLQRLTEAVLDQTGSTDAANYVLAANAEKLREVMRAAGFTEDQINEYTASLGLIPPGVVTTITADTSQAEASISRVQAALNALTAGANATVGELFSYGGQRATGGPVEAGKTYTVGELGTPELLTLYPGGGGHVTALGPPSAPTVAPSSSATPQATDAIVQELRALRAELARVKQPTVIAHGADAREVAAEVVRKQSRAQMLLPA